MLLPCSLVFSFCTNYFCGDFNQYPHLQSLRESPTDENPSIDPYQKLKPFTLTRKEVEQRREEIALFLFEHLGPYGDPLTDIFACLDHTLVHHGAVHAITSEGKFLAITVLNATGMRGYIPANILVYIAADQDHRGKGLGRTLMQHALASTDGGVALHVEPNNPARRLYERLGFTQPYLEMRWNPADQSA